MFLPRLLKLLTRVSPALPILALSLVLVPWNRTDAQATSPWTVVQPGYTLELVATNFQLPVGIAFVPHPQKLPRTPLFYVAELYGTIKVVTYDNQVSVYATGLLNFDPTGEFPGSGEQGVSSITVDSATGDLFATMLYDSGPQGGFVHYPKVDRFHSTDGGMTAATRTTLLTMSNDPQGQSHFISNVTIGPDRKIYFHMGDGGDSTASLDTTRFNGKVIRMNFDGSAPPDNPFYNAANPPGSAKNYVYALGLRNAFGGAWRSSDGFQYAAENGVDTADRILRIFPGKSYGWNGTDTSLVPDTLFDWHSDPAPINLAFVQRSVFDGSGFPAGEMDHAFVTLSGDTWTEGPDPISKRIVDFTIGPGPNGKVKGWPADLIVYTGTGRATAAGLAAGPDGLYFTDLYKDQNYASPIDSGANVFRIRYTGGTAVAGETPRPIEYALSQNYPNPFNPSTTIRYAIPHRTHVSLTVYDLLGRLVATLVDGDIEAGFHEVRFAADNLASGMYVYRLTTGDFVQAKSFMVLR